MRRTFLYPCDTGCLAAIRHCFASGQAARPAPRGSLLDIEGWILCA
jgi:hypothetical protein